LSTHAIELGVVERGKIEEVDVLEEEHVEEGEQDFLHEDEPH